MFLKILEKLGRKKIVLDRGPSHPKFNLAKPWMNRYYVLFRNRPRWFPFNIPIHMMLLDHKRTKEIAEHINLASKKYLENEIGRAHV